MNNSIETILSQTSSSPRVLRLVTTANGQLIIEENEKYRWIRDNYKAYYSILDRPFPSRLVLPYLKTMMAALLFIPVPESVVVLGAGGGALMRFFENAIPDCNVQAIDYDNTVIEITEKYFLTPKLSNSTIMNIDAVDYVSRSSSVNTDLMFIDLFAHGAIPDFFNEISFYENCNNNSGADIIIYNMIIDTENTFKHIISMLFSAFNKRCLCLTVPDYKNIIILAFTSEFDLEKNLQVLHNRCRSLQGLYNINFTVFLDEIVSSSICVDNKLLF